MQVYVEYALLENFCMDFVLLATAKILSKNLGGYRRVALASALGACFAVVYPLFGIQSNALAVVCKLAAGVGLCLAGARLKPVKNFLKFCVIFLALTFLAGGMLLALFALSGASYQSGTGYILSSVPIGIPLCTLFLLFFAAKKISKKWRGKCERNGFRCHIVVGEYSVMLHGFFDSGNNVYCRGQPVSFLSLQQAKKLWKKNTSKPPTALHKWQSVVVHTVAGSQTIKVFTADKIEIFFDGQAHTIHKVLIGISPHPVQGVVLHPDLSEAISCLKK